MKTTTLNNFSGLTYVRITNVPIKESEFGPVINIKTNTLEKLVASALIIHKFPIRGLEFKVMKSALRLSNDAISAYLGLSRNTVLKWTQNPEDRLSPSFEMLVRVLVAEKLNIQLKASIEDLKPKDKYKNISISAEAA